MVCLPPSPCACACVCCVCSSKTKIIKKLHKHSNIALVVKLARQRPRKAITATTQTWYLPFSKQPFPSWVKCAKPGSRTPLPAMETKEEKGIDAWASGSFCDSPQPSEPSRSIFVKGGWVQPLPTPHPPRISSSGLCHVISYCCRHAWFRFPPLRVCLFACE